MRTRLHDAIEQDGFSILPGALSPVDILAIVDELTAALANSDDGPIRQEREQIAASRNVLHLWPQAIELARADAIRRAIVEILGDGCGLVRALYFDKPPGRSWALPWHKDRTIAVRDNRQNGTQFRKPTLKAGVPHVEAPETVLRQMLTARVHLDDVDKSNGPLLVVPGSHWHVKSCVSALVHCDFYPVHVRAGDVLLMRPLVTHCSRDSHPAAQRHRRILHFEFASAAPLPDGFQWYDFHALDDVHAR